MGLIQLHKTNGVSMSGRINRRLTFNLFSVEFCFSKKYTRKRLSLFKVSLRHHNVLMYLLVTMSLLEVKHSDNPKIGVPLFERTFLWGGGNVAIYCLVA